MLKLLWIFGLRAFKSVWDPLLLIFVMMFRCATMQKQAKSNNYSWRNFYSYIQFQAIHGTPKKFLFIHSISIFQCYQLFLRLWKLMADQKEFKNRLKPRKMNILLNVFRFKLSTDRKGIMICLGWVKLQRALFRQRTLQEWRF